MRVGATVRQADPRLLAHPLLRRRCHTSATSSRATAAPRSAARRSTPTPRLSLLALVTAGGSVVATSRSKTREIPAGDFFPALHDCARAGRDHGRDDLAAASGGRDLCLRGAAGAARRRLCAGEGIGPRATATSFVSSSVPSSNGRSCSRSIPSIQASRPQHRSSRGRSTRRPRPEAARARPR